jgi:ribonucleotide reductase beta subunit family protein with ferritin-like domain
MSHTVAADRISYEDLYARWEQGNWRATEIDFSTDREQWQTTFTDIERRAALWTYSMFFHGEDSVADNLSPYIEASM